MTLEFESLIASAPVSNLQSLPVNAESQFSNHKGVYKPRIEKRQRGLLEKISFIQPFLEDGEKILLITTACSPMSPLEQMFTGAIVFILKRSLLVFTDRRILHIPTNSDYSYRNSIAQILCGDCESIRVKGRTLVVKYKNAATEKFFCIAGQERKKAKKLLTEIPLDGQQSPQQRRTHLCPRCTQQLTYRNYTCPSCGLRFKSKAKARTISIIYPGGGYFYTGHPFLGFADASAEIYLSIFWLVALHGVKNGEPSSIFILLAFSLMLILEKALTVFHSNRFVDEYLPAEKIIKTSPPPSPSVDGLRTDKLPKTEEVLVSSWRKA